MSSRRLIRIRDLCFSSGAAHLPFPPAFKTTGILFARTGGNGAEMAGKLTTAHWPGV